METMKYYCPRRCHINDKGGMCPRCGMGMRTLGRVDGGTAMKKIGDERLGRKNKIHSPYKLKYIS